MWFHLKRLNMKNAKTTCHTFILSLILTSTVSYAQQKAEAPKTLKSSGYAPVNGLRMYYEVHGDGKPLVLLHGSYMTIDLNFAQLIPELAKNYKVIALEMQGHGRTGDIDRPYSYPALASDIDGLLKHLKIDSADVLGYSLGGTVAFELAIKHPQRVTSLVIISSVFRHDGWLQSARDLFPTIKPEFFENTPLKAEYDRLAPDKSHWKDWVNKMVASEVIPFDLGSENVKRLKCPVLIISGDNDGVDLNHIAEMYKLCGGGVFGDIAGLPKSRLAIVPGMTHVTLMMETAKLVSIINPFLK
jgi:pimeloyl-ACP methyl ester carboxylesterase